MNRREFIIGSTLVSLAAFVGIKAKPLKTGGLIISNLSVTEVSLYWDDAAAEVVLEQLDRNPGWCGSTTVDIDRAPEFYEIMKSKKTITLGIDKV